MIQRLFPVLFVIFLIYLQVMFHTISGRGEVFPDTIPLAVAIAALRWGRSWAVLIGFLAGTMADSFSTTLWGLNALAWVTAGTLGGSIKDSLYGNRIAVALFLVAVLKMAHGTVFYIIFLWGYPLDILDKLAISTPLAALYSAGLALVLLLPLNRLLLE